MRRGYLFLLFVPALAVGIACGHSYTSANDNAPKDAGTVSDVVTTPDGPVYAQPCPGGCLAMTPAGWTGPSAIVETALDAGPSTCPLTYPQREADTFYADAGAATDGGLAACACGASQPADPGTYNAVFYIDAGCTGSNVPALVAAKSGCSNRSSFGSMIVTNQDKFPCCEQPAQGAPPALEQTQVTSCAARITNACTDRADCIAVTTPDQPFARVCIHTDGDKACPNSDYPNRFVSYASVTDGRSCNACTSAPAGSACGVYGFFGTACGPPGVRIADDAGCVSLDVIDSVEALGVDDAGCAVDGGGVTGEVTSGAATTYCCTN